MNPKIKIILKAFGTVLTILLGLITESDADRPGKKL